MAEYVHPRFVIMHAHALECEYSPCLFQSELANARRISRSLLSEGRAQEIRREDTTNRANHRIALDNTCRPESNTPWWDRVAILNISQIIKPPAYSGIEMNIL
jgi:hypothetical protein